VTASAEAPDAPVIRADARSVYVRCPYCGAQHAHERRSMPRGERTRRAPGCGNIRSNAQRATGYWITTT
jgi:hypothetical protein